MRGTPTRPTRQPSRPGIIPAYAGNTSNNWWPDSASRDHPRVCGEHTASSRYMSRFEGSSPRMRGTHGGQCDLRCRAGIIPAYAGNTIRPYKVPPAVRDHPRVCGEHLPDALAPSMRQGSSPRMRGTLFWCSGVCPDSGIIPAYAGNTGNWTWPSWWIRDHPRVCGEHVELG